jgi:DNA-binding beta-propeller fold protein YncE
MTLQRYLQFSFCLVFVLVLAATLLATNAYHQVKRIPIPGNEGWDYITADSQARRLYVPHGTEVVVIDLDSGAIVGAITGQNDVHGVAIAREFGHGFISASDPGSVTMFDLKTMAVLHKERVGDDPNGIIYDPGTNRVFSADRGSKRLTAIDAATGKTVGMIDNLGGRTEHLAADGSGHVFLNMQDVGKLHKLDVQGFKIMETWTRPAFRAEPFRCGRCHQRRDRRHATHRAGCGRPGIRPRDKIDLCLHRRR